MAPRAKQPEPAAQEVNAELLSDAKTVIGFIFQRFGAPVDAADIPDDVARAVRRIERAEAITPAARHHLSTVISDPVRARFDAESS